MRHPAGVLNRALRVVPLVALSATLLLGHTLHAYAQGTPSTGPGAPTVPTGGTQESSDKPRIAVLEFSRLGATEVEAAAVTDEVRNELVKSGRFQVLERVQINAVLKEQAFQQAAVDAKQAIEAGKLLGVEYIVTGRLIKPGPDGYQLSVQSINVETGRITFSETAQYEGPILGFLKQFPALTARAVAKVFGEPPPPVGQELEPTKPRPATDRVFAGPYTWIDLTLVSATTGLKESLTGTAITGGYDRFFTEHLAASVDLHLGQVTEVRMPDESRAKRTVSASGNVSMATLSIIYSFFVSSNWMLHAGGGIYLATADYRMMDYTFSAGQETNWTFNANGLVVRFGADYQTQHRFFFGVIVDGDVLSSYSGSRIDAYARHGGINNTESGLSAVAVRVGYNL